MSCKTATQHIHKEAFANLHNQYRERLLTAITAMARNKAHAENITASTFAAAFRNLDSFRGESSLYTCLYQIGLNKVRSLHTPPKQHRIRAIRCDFVQTGCR